VVSRINTRAAVIASARASIVAILLVEAILTTRFPYTQIGFSNGAPAGETAMIKLYGFAYSNYYNIVKHSLLYKGIPFEEVEVYPNSPEMMTVNPTGKVPAMRTEQGGSLSESSVILDYLEDAYPDVPLYPTDAQERAAVRQLMKISELYLELPARRLIPSLFSKTSPNETLLGEVRTGLDRGVRSVNALASFSPYVAGDSFTLADIYLRYVLSVVMMVCPPVMGWQVADEIDGLGDWLALMAESDISKKIDADQKANEPAFMAYVGSVAG